MTVAGWRYRTEPVVRGELWIVIWREAELWPRLGSHRGCTGSQYSLERPEKCGTASLIRLWLNQGCGAWWSNRTKCEGAGQTSQDVDLLRCEADVAEMPSVGVWVDLMVSTQRGNNLQKRTKSPHKLFYIKVAGYHMTSHPILHPFSIPLPFSKHRIQNDKNITKFPRICDWRLMGIQTTNPRTCSLAFISCSFDDWFSRQGTCAVPPEVPLIQLQRIPTLCKEKGRGSQNLLEPQRCKH